MTRKRIWVGDLVRLPFQFVAPRDGSSRCPGQSSRRLARIRGQSSRGAVCSGSPGRHADGRASVVEIRITSRTARSTGTISTSGDFSVDPPRRRWRENHCIFFWGVGAVLLGELSRPMFPFLTPDWNGPLTMIPPGNGHASDILFHRRLTLGVDPIR